MLAQASTGLVETFWVSRLGADALAGMALVFPGFTMMQMLSAGAVGGGISSAIARALGGGRRDDANALVLHAIIIDLTLGLFFRSWWWRSAPRCTARSAARAARSRPHCNIRTSCSPGTWLVWLMNALASAIRGTGNMLVPSTAICGGVALLVRMSPCLIFGLGPFPALGMAGAGIAVVTTTALTAVVLACYLVLGRSIVLLGSARLRWTLFADILRVGAVASITTFQTTLTVLLTTALVGAAAGPGAIAGYGTGARLEYL